MVSKRFLLRCLVPCELFFHPNKTFLNFIIMIYTQIVLFVLNLTLTAISHVGPIMFDFIIYSYDKLSLQLITLIALEKVLDQLCVRLGLYHIFEYISWMMSDRKIGFSILQVNSLIIISVKQKNSCYI